MEARSFFSAHTAHCTARDSQKRFRPSRITGIGLGIGVPHVRLEGVPSLSMAVGIHPTGVDDYESLDGEPVRIIVLIVGGKKQHSDYIRLLANLVAVLKDEARRQSLLSATTTDEVYRLLVGSPEAT